MSFENLAKDLSFVSGLELLNNVDDKKFVRLVDRMIRDFEPNRLSSFSKPELASMEKALKLNSNECQCLLNCLSQLLKEVISDVTKPLILKNVLSKLFLLNEKKVELFCECWSTNAEQVVSRLQQNLTHSCRLKDVNWALNISSNVGLGIELSDPEPRCLIELKVEDTHYHNEPKIKEINLDLDEKELKKLYDTLEKIQVKLDSLSN
ncbi:COMM domain-containing protein 10-like isoform X1 [Aphis craccivora]|uniref:COMM domain-containing protein 10-like isoform X1 n=1 Tax=Aphis craccivora TaxID=307492 RepID=A0A6G0Z883_APHCR|nr:COMM domain-containing protein 10-like isoform X1 [Aphis craccivora]